MELKPMTDKKSLPPNIKEFNEISTIILGEVYKSHPHPVTIDPARIATILGVAPSEKLPSGRTFSDMFAHTIAWLAREGVLSDLAAVVPHRATLTAKTLAAMRGTIGSQFID